MIEWLVYIALPFCYSDLFFMEQTILIKIGSFYVTGKLPKELAS